MKLVLVLAALVVVVSGQGTLLSLPQPELCASRPKQWEFNGHWYFFSWDQDEYLETDPTTGKTKGKKVNWLEARNECRKRCMDAVGMETEAENNMIFDFLNQRNLSYIWTSGRLCDFTGCEAREDLKPISVLGWFWSNTNTKMAPTNSTPPGWAKQPWSQTGHKKLPQPDNAEFDINQTPESCMGVLNNIYNDSISWHDIACYHPKPFVCEDSELLLNYVDATNPELNLLGNNNEIFNQNQQITSSQGNNNNNNNNQGSSTTGFDQNQGSSSTGFSQNQGSSSSGFGQNQGSSSTGFSQTQGSSNTGFGQNQGSSSTGFSQNQGSGSTGFDQNQGNANNRFGQNQGSSNNRFGQTQGSSNAGFRQTQGSTFQG